MSRTRRNLRKVLGVLLVLSLGFFMGTATLYGAIKLRYVKVLDIAPTLFEIDILQYQARAALSNPDGKFFIANKMLDNGLFARTYTGAGLIMLENLAISGHPPSQTMQADLMLRYTPEKKDLAIAFYKSAAAQGFEPAQTKLDDLEKQAAE